MKPATRWRKFEKLLKQKKLDWGLHYAPAHLRHARTKEHFRGTDLGDLLPKAYREFVADVGYPVLGFRYYDGETFSFLPPEPMEVLSAMLPDYVGNDFVFPKSNKKGPTKAMLAFFAGYDLSDINGYAFKPEEEGGEPVVWCIEDGGPVEPMAPFEAWLSSELERFEEAIDGFDGKRAGELREENGDEDDPHRLIDYSLGGSYDVKPFSAADKKLAWVEDQAGDPYSYGLVDERGEWLIPMGKRFKSVTPFRKGRAAVILNDKQSSYEGPWREIDTSGKLVG